jgi:hypothetical protein
MRLDLERRPLVDSGIFPKPIGSRAELASFFQGFSACRAWSQTAGVFQRVESDYLRVLKVDVHCRFP